MHTELGRWRRAWRRVGKATVDVEVEEEGEEAHEEAEEKEEEESWSRRKRTTLIKSNNPHLAGGEKHLTFGPLLEVEMSKNCTPFVARSTFPSQNVQNTPGSDHFWKFRCRKSARRCGAKHISKSKC